MYLYFNIIFLLLYGLQPWGITTKKSQPCFKFLSISYWLAYNECSVKEIYCALSGSWAFILLIFGCFVFGFKIFFFLTMIEVDGLIRHILEIIFSYVVDISHLLIAFVFLNMLTGVCVCVCLYIRNLSINRWMISTILYTYFV